MPNQKTIIKQEYSQLAWEHTDIASNLIYNQVSPGFGIDDETGQFRVGADDDWFEERYTKMSKFTIAEEHGESDSLANFNLKPEAIAWKYSNLDLNHPQKFGSRSRQEMINKRFIRESRLLKKKKEKDYYAAVATDANFVDGTYFNDATVKWSTPATADPVLDITTGKLIVDSANALAIPYRSFVDLQNVSRLQSLTNVAGLKRDKGINPTITVDWLLNVFQLDFIFVARGKLKTDSSDPSSSARSDIWGNKALLFYFNPSEDNVDGHFLQHLFLNTPGANADEGWIATETVDNEPGLVGVTRWQLGSYYQFLSQRKELGYRIDALY